ncbi:MAG: carboxypeptidase regulatory-like protein [Verrucomicrobiales bacterium]|nr:carboxypeptidase regulatory-like protein [Verrucomicrobiales bacterium]
MKPLIFSTSLLTAVMPLASCGLLPPDVIVLDNAGSPVARAEVEPVSASINYKPVLTNSKGHARFGPEFQKREWFNVGKDGYAPHAFVNISGPKPVRVILTKAP